MILGSFNFSGPLHGPLLDTHSLKKVFLLSGFSNFLNFSFRHHPSKLSQETEMAVIWYVSFVMHSRHLLFSLIAPPQY